MGWAMGLCPESQKPLQRGSVAARKFLQFGGFCGNFHQSSRCFVAQFSFKCRAVFMENFNKFFLLLLTNFHKNCCHLIGNFHKKLSLWLISTKKWLYAKFLQKKSCLYEKFPQNFVWLENCHNHRLCWKIFATSCFLRTFSQNFV